MELTLFTDESLYLPKEYMGEVKKNGGYTINPPRTWTDKEIEWMEKLKERGGSIEQIAKYLYRDKVSVSIKLKRLKKRKGAGHYNKHIEDKYKTNDMFLDVIKPESILDLYSGEKSYYEGKAKQLITNDAEKSFCGTYNMKAEKLVCLLYYQNQSFDLIDLDPFGSAFDCFDLAIKMAKKGIAITLGEIGHKRFKRLDYVERYYGINDLKEFTTGRLVEEIIKIGRRNKKELIPVFVKEYKNISRVYFQIEKIKITKQWEYISKNSQKQP